MDYIDYLVNNTQFYPYKCSQYIIEYIIKYYIEYSAHQ